jgi:hypothetical protein
MADADRRKRLTGYALGMLAESGWILAMTALALLMAVIAKAIWP